MHKVYWAVVAFNMFGDFRQFVEYNVDGDENLNYLLASQWAINHLDKHSADTVTICRVSNVYGWVPFRSADWRFHYV